MRIMIIAIGLAVMAVPVVAQSLETSDFPSDVLLLIQSELDYLEVANRKISLAIDKAKPDQALKQIAAVAGVSIEVNGTLPEKPTLTKSFENASVKEVFIWYAKEVPVVYKAESPDRLMVLARGDVRRVKRGAS